MKVNFTIHGSTADELRDEADRVLALLDPAARWTVNITASPKVETTAGSIHSWEGEVDAHDNTDRQA